MGCFNGAEGFDSFNLVNVLTDYYPGPTPSFCTSWSFLEFTFLNAIDNTKLAGVILEVKVNGNFYTFVTDEEGSARQTIQKNAYQGMLIEYNCSKEGFISKSGMYQVPDPSTDPILQVFDFLSPTLTSDEKYRAVLSWGLKPEDLDLKVLEFKVDVTCESYYDHKNCSGTSLDVENSDRGVETVTWNDMSEAFSYLIVVEDYSDYDDYPLANSKVIYTFF